MSKVRYHFLRIGISGGIGMALYIMLQLLLALLIVKGILPEKRWMISQFAAGGVSTLLGGFVAIRITKWIPAAMLTGIFVTGIAMLLGMGIYDVVLLNTETLLRAIVMLAGGALPALLFGKQGRRRAGGAVSRRARRI